MPRPFRPERKSIATITTFVSTRPCSLEVVPLQEHLFPEPILPLVIHSASQAQASPLAPSTPRNARQHRPPSHEYPIPVSSSISSSHTDSNTNKMAWLAKRTTHDRHFVMKMVLRAVCLAFTLASLIAAAASLRGFEAAWFVTFYPAAWAASVLWNLVWICIMLGRQRQIAPGVIVAFDLIIWLYYLVPAVFGWFTYVDISGDYWYYERYYSISDRDSMAAGAAASNVFAFLAIVTHFWLFVLGCIDEDRRRKAMRNQLLTLAANHAAMTAGGAGAGAQVVHHNHGAAGHFTHCIDCHGVINLRCADCAASAAARGDNSKAPAAGATGLPGYFAQNAASQPNGQESVAESFVDEKGRQVVSEGLR